MNIPAIVWFGLMVFFLVVEAACPIHLVSLWFATGSLAATVVALLSGPVWLQAVVFLAVSAALLALLWPLTKKFLNPTVTKTNVDTLPGSTCRVTADIDNIAAVGQVKLNGMEWSARSTSGDPIQAGALVKVDRIEGVKAFVSEVKVNANV